jgi:GntR family transcriptional regulator, transcriptional repressor for pyruvate dehydrogenase complex
MYSRSMDHQLLHGLAPVRIRPAWEQIADALRDLLTERSTESDQRLPPEVALAELLGVSRGTLRRAMRQLSDEGLVISRTGMGAGTYVVAPVGQPVPAIAAQLPIILRTRRQLEVPASAGAAGSVDPARLFAIERRRCLAATHAERFVAHRAFHQELLRAGATPLWSDVCAPLYEWLGSNLRRERAPGEVWDAVALDHRDIIDAAVAGDARAAMAGMAAHLDRLEKCYLEMA